jgi:hypothetical protein
MGGGKKRARRIDSDGNIIEWDYQHGRVEKYDSKGKHLGEFDPDNGAQTRPRKPGLTPAMFEKPSKKTYVVLAWYSKTGDDLWAKKNWSARRKTTCGRRLIWSRMNILATACCGVETRAFSSGEDQRKS